MLAVKRRPLPGRPRGRRPGPGGCAAGQPVPVPPCGVRSRSGALPVPGVVGAGGCGDRAAAEGSVAGSGITGAAFASRPEAVRDLPPPAPPPLPGPSADKARRSHCEDTKNLPPPAVGSRLLCQQLLLGFKSRMGKVFGLLLRD